MSRQSSSTFTQFPHSGRFRSSNPEYEDQLEFLEQEDAHYSDLTLNPQPGRGGLYGVNGLVRTLHPYVPKPTSNARAGTSSRSQSRRRNPSSRRRNDAQSAERRSRLYSGLKTIFTSDWTLPLVLTALALWMWKVPSTAFFWHPAASMSPLDRIISAAIGEQPDRPPSALKHQLCKLPIVPRLLHCPQPENLEKKKKRVHKDKWSRIFWTLEDQYDDIVCSRMELSNERAWKISAHSQNLSVLVHSQNDLMDLRKKSINRDFKAMLERYDKLPAQQYFVFLQARTWPTFVRDLAYSYDYAKYDAKVMVETFETIDKEVDELLKALLDMSTNEYMEIWHVQQQSTWTDIIKSSFGSPRGIKKMEINMEEHEYVVDLRAIQPLIREILQDSMKRHAALLRTEVYLKSDPGMNMQAALGTRPKFVQEIIEGVRESIEVYGYVGLPTMAMEKS